MKEGNSNISQYSVVNTLENHIERLIADHRRLTALVKELREQCDELKQDRREQHSRIAELEREVAKRTLVAGLQGNADDNRRAKAYVNRLMREVDSCITLLSAATGANEEPSDKE